MPDLTAHHFAADRHRRTTPRRARRISSPTHQFVRHYVEMVVVMFLGDVSPAEYTHDHAHGHLELQMAA
jgi:hypothetical protein